MKMSLFIFLSLFISSVGWAQELSFDDVWKQFYESSHEMESLRKEKEANQLALDRGNLHWVPKVSLMGQWSDTNDPGQVFFNNLGQRSVTQADFNPSRLNDPDRAKFINGIVGVDLPLYEGGMKSNQASMLKVLARSSDMDIKSKKTEQFSELSRQYGSVIVHETNASALKGLQDDLKRIISSYQVGSKSNPVGYSGLLGLKGVANRIEGLLTAFEMQLSTNKEWISSKAGIKGNWSPVQKKNLQEYLDQTLVEESSQSFSSMLLANELKASTLSYVSEMEKARYLPKVGLFAQNNLYSGDRDTENSQSFGLYLMWELFNSDSYNRASEARAKAMAAESKMSSAKQEEGIMKKNLALSKEALEKNLLLLSDSNVLLNEQSRNSMKLFNSGLLNALQLAEVINRRVDVIEQKNIAEIQYLDVRSRLHQLSH